MPQSRERHTDYMRGYRERKKQQHEDEIIAFCKESLVQSRIEEITQTNQRG